jgi:murein DD-endopeptidase MepM/ murein hydrolase activator NlpD
MRSPGSTPSRVAHAHPLTPDARASRAAVAFRVAERRTRGSRHARRRLPIPVLAIAAGVIVLVLARPLIPTSTDANELDVRGNAELGLVLDRNHADGASAADLATPAPTAAAVAVGTPAGRIADDSRPMSNGYRWPVDHARITQAFGPSGNGLFVVDGQRFHDGVDIANFCGAPILAGHAGTVLAASRHVVSELGWTADVAAYDAYLAAKHLWASQARIIVIDDGNGYRSVYVHLHRIDVHRGDVVRAGQQIGLEGSSGNATGCHLHYSLFSPNASGRYRTDPTEAKRYHLPSGEIARIDPLSFLPPLSSGWISWGWGAKATD